jgi:hypothetical protein
MVATATLVPDAGEKRKTGTANRTTNWPLPSFREMGWNTAGFGV